MIQKIKDYHQTFQSMRLLALLSLLGFMTSSLLFFILYRDLVEEQQEKVYVVTDTGTLSGKLSSNRDVSIHEARYLSEIFFEHMFSHDAATYEHHLDKALHFIDEPSGLMIVETFDKGDVQNNYIRWGSRTEVVVDSIRFLTSSLPIQSVAYFRQLHYIGKEKKSELSIACRYDVIKTHRHEQNPFGLQITQLDFIPYAPYETQ